MILSAQTLYCSFVSQMHEDALGEFGPACGEQTHALARTAAAKPGPAWPWALGELWGSALTVHCLLWGSFGVVGKLLGEPDFFGIAFSRPTAPRQ